jgi:hypothetical protein
MTREHRQQTTAYILSFEIDWVFSSVLLGVLFFWRARGRGTSFEVFCVQITSCTERSDLNSGCPVFCGQITDTPELSRIVRNQGQAQAAGMGGNKQIIRADHGAMLL